MTSALTAAMILGVIVGFAAAGILYLASRGRSFYIEIDMPSHEYWMRREWKEGDRS